jgi:hypothetical protein
MRKLICIALRHHRPVATVGRFENGHAVCDVRCPACGKQ